MSTRSSARNLFPPLDNPEITIRRRSRVDPTLLNDSEMAIDRNGDPLVPDLQTMEELCQPSLNGRALKAEIEEINKNLMRFLHINQQVKADTPNCETSGGPHSYNDCPATIGQIQNVYAAGAYQGGNSYQPQDEYRFILGLGTLLSNIITNPKEDLKGIITQSGTAYQGPTIPTTSSSLPQVVESETEVTKDPMHPTNNGRTKDVQPPVVQVETPNLNFEPVVAPVIKPITEPVSALKPNPKPLIPYPSRLHDQKLHDKANDQKEKFFQIFQDLNFNISFAVTFILMPKFGPTTKTLLTNMDKLSELARTSLNERCSVVLLKKLPEKLRDPDKFLISCDFPGMDECLALADLGASINLMPLSVVAEDVFVKVGTFHFPTDFVVVDFDADHRVPLILERSFLKIKRPLIDVFEGELTPRVGKEAITFNLDQTSRYSANYNDMTANRIDVIDMACEEYSQEVLSFFDVIASGNPTPYYDPIISTSSLTLTPFGDSDFLLEEVDAFLALEDDPTSPEVELKDLPPHLEYTFLEGDDKLPVIIAKDLSDEEKTALIKVLKSHMQAIAWKLSDIKGINLEFCTHKILIEDDFKPAVQHQRRVNPKIYDVIKKEGGFTIVENEENELIPTRLVTRWHVMQCTGNSFETCLSHLEKMIKRCEDTNLYLNWEKCHYMVKEGIIIDHKISKNGIEVDKAKVDVIAKLPHPTTVKGICSFLGHGGLYRQFIQDFLKIAQPIPIFLRKIRRSSSPKSVLKPFKHKKKLTEEPILIAPDWDLPFELMCDASNFAIGGSLKPWFKKILERTAGENCASWSDKQDDALWAFRTAFKTPIGCTPYKHVYGKSCHLPIELEHKAYWALKHANFDLQTADDHRKVQINDINKLLDQAYENSLIYKEKTKRLHDSKIKDRVFNVGDRVLLFNYRLKIFLGKLKTCWS
uniref:Reverse transcriptase domain-containing protein n=1 Tax=Tanacetum cinerariifolium TaxID=118510 RepID=A0A6L2LFG4_TANCI|nr:reverse transcriptase domain-containing protein [Tanacetum cinerariifolium]